MNKLAIAISSGKRPNCLKQCLKSLERNLSRGKADIYVYQDGAINFSSGIRYIEDEVIEENVQIFRDSKLPNKFLRRYTCNIGAGLQRLYQWTTLFNEGYEYVIHLDDDIVVSKYYIRTMLKLFKQFQDRIDIGMIQTQLREQSLRGVPQATVKEAKKIANQVQYGYSLRWEQGLWKRSWEAIKPYMGKVMRIFEGFDYKLLADDVPDLRLIRAMLIDTYGGYYVDLITENCLIREGFMGLSTRVNRHRVVESEGAYVFPGNTWKSRGFDKITLFDIPPPRKFRIVNNRLCIAIRTLKRANCLHQVLLNFNRNRYIRDTDFYFYIDGTVNPYSGIRYAKERDPIRCLYEIQMVRLPNTIIVMKKQNVQTAMQKYEMLSTLFPRYDYVMLLDNDLVPDTFYVDTILKMFKQFKDDPKAGILSTSPWNTDMGQGANSQTPEEAQTLRNKVQRGFGPRWEQGFWRKTWQKIKPYIDRYYMPHVQGCDYKQLLDNHPSCYKNRAALLEFFPCPNADLVLEFVTLREGYRGLRTKVWHYKPIGAEGMYSFSSLEFWSKLRLDQIVPHGIYHDKKFSF